MSKKVLVFSAIILVLGLFILTGCDNAKEENGNTEKTTEIQADKINSETITDEDTTTTSTMTDKDYYEKAVEFVKNEIIKTEDHINTKSDYKKFAEYEGFGVSKENGVTYAYMWIGDMSYYKENGKVITGSGSSMAYKVKFKDDEPVSYENPTDGAGQKESIMELFPKDVANKILNYNFDFTKLDDLANEYYK